MLQISLFMKLIFFVQ